MQLVVDNERVCSCGLDDSEIMGSAQYCNDPYSVLDSIRENCPVHWSRALGGWLLTRYEDVDWCLRNASLFSSKFNTARKVAALSDEMRESARPLIQSLDGSMVMFQDPPEHTRQRRILNKSFLPGHVASLEDGIRTIARELLDEHRHDHRMDLVADFARPMPGRVLCEFLGVPIDDQSLFVEWGQAASSFAVNPSNDEEIFDRALTAFHEMSRYIESLISDRGVKSEGEVDVIKLMVHGEASGAKLSHQEIVATCIQLLYAGHLSSTLFLTIGSHTLLTHPNQLSQLVAEPSLLPGAIEEMMRYDGPVLIISARTAVEQVVRHGQTILPGEAVFAGLGPTGRDPRIYDAPEEFDVQRKGRRHLQFGAGPHVCVGAPVARIDARVAFEELLPFLATVHFAEDDIVWRPAHHLRQLEALHVEW